MTLVIFTVHFGCVQRQ